MLDLVPSIGIAIVMAVGIWAFLQPRKPYYRTCFVCNNADDYVANHTWEKKWSTQVLSYNYHPHCIRGVVTFPGMYSDDVIDKATTLIKQLDRERVQEEQDAKAEKDRALRLLRCKVKKLRDTKALAPIAHKVLPY